MKPAKTKETCATCGKPLPLNNEGPLCIACARAFVGLPPAPQSEAASNVCVCRHMPCPVYPCPCACHRQGPHVPTDECEKAEEVIKTLTIADDRHFDEMSERGRRANAAEARVAFLEQETTYARESRKRGERAASALKEKP
jgi:hypothetical protein